MLEIGCGIETDTVNFAKAGAQVTAIDYSERSLEIARNRAKTYGLDITFYHANCEELSKKVPVEKYDLVYSFGVIHHTLNPELAVSELCKYMDPESILKIMVYHRNSWKVFWIVFALGKGAFWNLEELIARYSEAQSGCPVTYAYPKKSIRGLLKGFVLTKIVVDHIFPFKIPEYRKYSYKKVWYFRVFPKTLFRWFEHYFGWHLCVTAKLDDAIHSRLSIARIQ